MIVVDASVILALLVRADADSPSERLRLAGRHWHAPHLIDLEVLQGLRRATHRAEVDGPYASSLVSRFRDLPIKRYPAAPLLDRIWALRANITAYDASYVALAEALDAPLITRDARLAAAPGHRARIELV